MPTVPARYARATERTFGGAVILAAALAVGAPLYFFLEYLPAQRSVTLEALSRELAARTDQRQMGLERWVRDGFQNAVTVAEFPSVRAFLADTAARRRSSGAASAHVNELLRLYSRTQELQRVLLVDDRAGVVASGQGNQVLAAGELHLLRAAIAQGTPAVGFHRHPVNARPDIGFAAPVTDARGRLVGAVLLEADPAEWVYPFLLSAPPLPQASSEALLVEQRGDSVVWVSPRRKTGAPPLEDRRMLAATRGLPMYDALTAGSRFAAYTDYNGDPVFASTRKIAGTPWGLVVKVDQAEILGPYLARMREEAAGWGAALVALLGLATVLWRNARRALEVEVARGLARQGAALDQANDVVLFVGLDGRVEGANRRAEAFYGAAGLIGRNVIDLRPAEARGQAGSQLAAVRDQGSLVFETVHLSADGTLVPVEVSSQRVHFDDGDQIVSVIRDIRERKAAEAAVRASEARYRSLFQGMLEGYAHCRMEFEEDAARDWVYLDVNPAFSAITGIKDAVGKRVTEIIPDIRATNPELFELYGRVARTGEPAQVESYVPALGIWFSLAVYCPAPGEFVAVFENITERKRTEREVLDLNAALEKRVDERTAELAQAIADLERANKELEAFAYSVSHDLRAPLRAIDGYGQMLEEDLAGRLDTEGRRLLGVVRSSTKGMGHLIDDLLAFSRAGREAVQRSQVDMEALVRSAWESVTTPAERGAIAFRLDALPAAECDPALMRQVWTNLLANAVKFTAPKGERTVEVRFRQEADRTTYVVADNGVGFDPLYRDKLFGVFQRLHSAAEFEGTGVGLALAQRIVHRHGGELRAEGALGQGATFFLTLPREGSTE